MASIVTERALNWNEKAVLALKLVKPIIFTLFISSHIETTDVNDLWLFTLVKAFIWLTPTVLVDPLSKAIGYRETLYLFFPGFIVTSKSNFVTCIIDHVTCNTDDVTRIMGHSNNKWHSKEGATKCHMNIFNFLKSDFNASRSHTEEQDLAFLSISHSNPLSHENIECKLSHGESDKFKKCQKVSGIFRKAFYQRPMSIR